MLNVLENIGDGGEGRIWRLWLWIEGWMVVRQMSRWTERRRYCEYFGFWNTNVVDDDDKERQSTSKCREVERRRSWRCKKLSPSQYFE
jgi:hypothetical protein